MILNFDIKFLETCLKRVAVMLGKNEPNEMYLHEFYDLYVNKITKQELQEMCRSIVKKTFYNYPNFLDWNTEYQKIYITKQSEELKERLKHKFGEGDNEKASHEDFQNVIKPLVEKFKSKSTDTEETERNNMKKLIEKRQKAREAGYVFCTDSQSWMHRDVCIKNGLGFKEI